MSLADALKYRTPIQDLVAPEPESHGAVSNLWSGLKSGGQRAAISFSDFFSDEIPLDDTDFVKNRQAAIRETEAGLSPEDRESAWYQGGTSVPTSLGVAGLGMVPAAATSVLAAPVLSPAGSIAAGSAVAAGVTYPLMYKTAMNDAMREVRDAIKEKYDITPEQWRNVQTQIQTEASKIGKAEAGWEAVGNALTFAIFKVPIGVIGKPIASLIGKKAAEKILGDVMGRAGVRVGAEIGMEVGTETATDVSQKSAMSEIQRKIPSDAVVSPPDYDPNAPLATRIGKSVSDVWAPTMVQAGFMAGLGATTAAASRLKRGKPIDLVGDKPPVQQPEVPPTVAQQAPQGPALRREQPDQPQPSGPSPADIFAFASRMASGQRPQDPQSLQFYENNKGAVEASLQAIRERRPVQYDENRRPFYPPVLWQAPLEGEIVEPAINMPMDEQPRMLPPGQGFEIVGDTPRGKVFETPSTVVDWNRLAEQMGLSPQKRIGSALSRAEPTPVDWVEVARRAGIYEEAKVDPAWRKLAEQSGLSVEDIYPPGTKVSPESITLDEIDQLSSVPDAITLDEIDQFLGEPNAEAVRKPVAPLPEVGPGLGRSALEGVAPVQQPVEAGGEAVEKPVGLLPPPQTFEEMMADAGSRVKKEKATAAKIAQESSGRPVVLTKDGDDRRGVLIHRSTKVPGKFQVSRWDDRGFSGDSTFNTIDEAVYNSVRDGYEIQNKAAFDRLSRSARFRAHVKATDLAQEYFHGGKRGHGVIEIPALQRPGAAPAPVQTPDEVAGRGPASTDKESLSVGGKEPDTIESLTNRFKPGNPFAERAAMARRKANLLNRPTARESAMAQAFPLGVGGSGKRPQNTNKQIDASVRRATEAVDALKNANWYEAQAKAFDEGKINAQGRSINKESIARSEKREAQKQSREERIESAKAVSAGKKAYEVDVETLATAGGFLGGPAKKLVLEDHRASVEEALLTGKLTTARAAELGHFEAYPELKPKEQAQPASGRTPTKAPQSPPGESAKPDFTKRLGGPAFGNVDVPFFVVNKTPDVPEGHSVVKSEIIVRNKKTMPAYRFSVVRNKDGETYAMVEREVDEGGSFERVNVRFVKMRDEEVERDGWINNTARKMWESNNGQGKPQPSLPLKVEPATQKEPADGMQEGEAEAEVADLPSVGTVTAPSDQPAAPAEDIFIRKPNAKERLGGVSRSRAIANIPPKDGFEAVYKPYGNTGDRKDAGFYYRPVVDQNPPVGEPQTALPVTGETQLAPTGRPYKTMNAAKFAARRKGEGYEAVEVEGGFGVRTVAKEAKVEPEAKSEAPKAERKADAKQQEPTATEDAGDELTYNRRNRIRGGIKWDDIKDKNTALQVKESTKQNVYPRPDYEKMIADGMKPMAAHLVKQVYDSIAAKPYTGSRAPLEADLKGYIEAVARVMDGVVKWATDANAIGRWAASQTRGRLNGAIALSDLAKADKDADTLLDMIYPGGWREAKNEINLLGGNKFLRALQPGFAEAKKATKEIEAGWPAKQEAWQRQGFKVEERDSVGIEKSMIYTDGKNTEYVYRIDLYGSGIERSHKTEAAAIEAIDTLKPWLLVDKSGRLKGQFDTKDEAVEAAREAVKREQRGGKISEKGISVEEADRIGPERRLEGEDVTSDRLIETFGFRGVNFGNWMKGDSNQAERQRHLNFAYDSFLDLAEILDIPPKAMSLDGMLGLAIGAQGAGGTAAAHFVPGVNEINLTRTSGAGSLAHEFGHALDHYFANQAGLSAASEPFLTEHTKSTKIGGEIRPEIVALFKKIVSAMNEKAMTPEQVKADVAIRKSKAKAQTGRWLESIRRQLMSETANGTMVNDNGKDVSVEDAFDAIAKRILDLDLGEGRVAAGRRTSLSPAVADIRDLFKKVTGRLYDMEQSRGLQANVDHYEYLNSGKASQRDHIPQMARTDYAERASKLDAEKKGKRYWSTELEKFARAFDAFVSDTLEEKAAKNTYLSHAGRADESVPQGEERKGINSAIRGLLDEVQTRETDSGVAMFSKSKSTDAEYLDAVERWDMALRKGQRVRVSQNETGGFGAISGKDGAVVGKFGKSFMVEVGGKKYTLSPDNLTPIGGKQRFKRISDEENKSRVDAYIEANKDKLDNIGYRYAEPGETFLRAVWEPVGNGELETNPLDAVSLPKGEKVSALHVSNEPEKWAEVIQEDFDRDARYRIIEIEAMPGDIVVEDVQQTMPTEMFGRLLDSGILVTGRELLKRTKDGVYFKQGTPTTGLPAATVERTVAEHKRTWKNAPPIEVVQDQDELPKAILKKAKGDRVMGVFWRGKVYLVAGNLKTDAKILDTLLHESFGHYGLRELLGKEGARPLLKQIWLAKVKEARKIGLEYKLDLTTWEGREQAAEEWLAREAQNNPESTWVDRAVRLVKDWLRKIGVDLEISDREIRAWLHDMRSVVVEGGTKGQGKTVMRYMDARFMVAFHGTPHVLSPEPGYPHGRFRLEFVGTGEGGAAYGHGIYFAEDKDLGAKYRDALSNPMSKVFNDEGLSVSDQITTNLRGNANSSRMYRIRDQYGESSEEYLSSLRQKTLNSYDFHIKSAVGKRKDSLIKQKETLAVANYKAVGDLLNPGSLYTLDIPQDVMEKLLDWDAPLSEQSEYVKKALADAGFPTDNRTGEEFYTALSRPMSKPGGSKKAASEYLASIGIPGNTHGGVSNGATGAKYVLWDQAALDKVALLERNGEKLDAIREAQEEEARFMMAGPEGATPEGVAKLADAKRMQAEGASRDEGLLRPGQKAEDVLISRKGTGTAMSADFKPVDVNGTIASDLALAKAINNPSGLSINERLNLTQDERSKAERASERILTDIKKNGAHKAKLFFRSTHSDGFAERADSGIFFANDFGTAKIFAGNLFKTEPSRMLIAMLDVKKPYFATKDEIEYNAGSRERWVAELKNNGYDSIVEIASDNESDMGYDVVPTEVAVFDESQIEEIGIVYNKEGRNLSDEALYKRIEQVVIGRRKNSNSDTDPDIMFRKEVAEATKQIDKETMTAAEKLKSILSRPGVKVSKKDLSIIELILQTPQFFKDGIRAIGKIYRPTQERQEEFYERVEGMEIHDKQNVLKVIDSLKGKQLKDFTDYILEADRTGEGFRIKQDEDGWHVMGLTGNVIATFESKLNKDDLTDAGEQQAIAEMLKAESDYLEAQGFSPEQIAAVQHFRIATNKGFDMLIGNMRKLRAMEKEGTIPPQMFDVVEDGKMVHLDLEEAMSRMNDLRGTYFPRIRKPAGYAIVATKPGAPSIRENVNAAQMMTTAKIRRDELRRQGYDANIVKNERLGEDVFEMAGQLIKTQQIVNQALERAERQTGIAEEGPTDADKIFASALSEQIANVIRERGARAHMTRRSKTVWLGYEEDVQVALAKYIRGLAGAEAKRNMIVKQLKALTGTDVSYKDFEKAVGYEDSYENFVVDNRDAKIDEEDFKAINDPVAYRENQDSISDLESMIKDEKDEETIKALKESLREKKGWLHSQYGKHVRESMIDQAKQPRAFLWAKTYISENSRNQEAVDRVVGTLRGLAVGKYLAFRVFAAPLVNLTALPTSVIATMKGAGIPYAKTWGLLGKGMKDYGLYRAGKLTGDDRAIFDHIHNKGWDNAQFNTEAMSVLRGAVGRKWDKVIEWGMLTFSESEKLNRAATISGTYRGLKTLHPDLSFEKLMDMAKEASDNAHGIYNRGNYPYLALGRHPAAHVFRAFYVFRTFSHTYMQNMARLGITEKDYGAVAHMAIAPAIIAGAGASVLTPILSMILKAFGADEPEEEAYRKIGKLFGGGTEELARYGLAGKAGVSVKGSLAIGIGDFPTTIRDLIGAPGSVVEDTWKGTKLLARGDTFKGVEKIAPTGAANIFRAIREYNEGLTTASNAPLFYGQKQVKPSLVEAFLRGASLNPVRIATIREKQFKEYQVADKYRKWNSDIYAKIKRWNIEGGNKEKWAEILGEIESYNRGSGRWGISPITPKSIRTNLRRAGKAPKRERERDN